MPIRKITKRLCDEVTLPKGKGQECYWDTDLPGFGLLVGKRARTFIIQRSGKNRTTIGRYGILTVHEGRELARRKLAEISVPGYSTTPSITFKQAIDLHAESMRRKGCSPTSLRDLHDRTGRHLKDWHDRPLAEITRREVREHHDRIGHRSGTYSANAVLRAFRAAYNTALKEHDLPQNPAIAVQWYKERRRQEPVADLETWYVKVMAMTNPIRRDYQLFVLFTGLRKTDAATVRWEDIDFDKGSLHRPNPKGGPDRAFTVPMSGYVMAILQRRLEENAMLYPGSPWVFPTRRTDRTISHIREAKQKGFPTPHRLRDTYHTACQEAGLSPYDIDVLTNHRPPSGSVSAGYIRQSENHLRQCQEKVTQHLLGRIGI